MATVKPMTIEVTVATVIERMPISSVAKMMMAIPGMSHKRVALRGLDEGDVGHHAAAQSDVDIRMCGSDIRSQFLDEVGNHLHFVTRFVRPGDRDVDARDVALRRDQTADELLVGERALLHVVRVLRRQLNFGIDKRRHLEVVAAGLEFAKIRDRVDAGGERRLPRLLRQLGERAQKRDREHVAVARRQDDEGVAGLGVFLLDPVERDAFGIRRPEIGARIRIERQINHAVGGKQRQQQRAQDQRQAPTQDPPSELVRVQRQILFGVALRDVLGDGRV